MQTYELLTVLPGTLDEQEVVVSVNSVQDLLSENGATAISSADLGKSRLAYPMKQIRYGYFRLFRFEAEPAHIPVIEKRLKLMGGLLRALVTKYDPTKQSDKEIRYGAEGIISSSEHKAAQARLKQIARPTEERVEEKREEVVEAPKEETPAEASVVEEKVEEVKKEKVSKEEKPKKEKKTTVKMEDIDKKLDALLEDDLTDSL